AMTYPRQAIQPGGWRRPGLPLSPAIRAGEFVFLSGMTATDPMTSAPARGTMAAETRQILTNMGELLEAAGTSLAKVVKVNTLIYSMLEYENMNSVYREFFPVDPPARTVCGARLIARHKLEIETVALSGATGWSDDRRCRAQRDRAGKPEAQRLAQRQSAAFAGHPGRRLHLPVRDGAGGPGQRRPQSRPDRRADPADAAQYGAHARIGRIRPRPYRQDDRRARRPRGLRRDEPRLARILPGRPAGPHLLRLAAQQRQRRRDRVRRARREKPYPGYLRGDDHARRSALPSADRDRAGIARQADDRAGTGRRGDCPARECRGAAARLFVLGAGTGPRRRRRG